MKRIILLLAIFVLTSSILIASVGAGATSNAETDAYVLAISEVIEIQDLMAPEGNDAETIEFYTLPVGASISLSAKADGVKQRISYYNDSNRRLGSFGMGFEGVAVTGTQSLPAGATVSYTLKQEDLERAFMSVDVIVGGKTTTYFFCVEMPVEKPAVLASNTEPLKTVLASPTKAQLYADSKEWALQAYNIGGNNYFKLRDIAYLLNGTQKQFEVAWSAEENSITLSAGKTYTIEGGEAVSGSSLGNQTGKPTSSSILLNGEEKAFIAYMINNNNYFKLRDLGAALDFGVEWDGIKGVILIDSTTGYSE